MQPSRAAGYLLCTYVAVALRPLWVKCMHANVSGGVRIEWRELLHVRTLCGVLSYMRHAKCVSIAAVFFGDLLRARCTNALPITFWSPVCAPFFSPPQSQTCTVGAGACRRNVQVRMGMCKMRVVR